MGRLAYLLSLILLSCYCLPLQAQVLNYGRSVVDTLASEALKGRGYVDSADYKAAVFIRNEFERFGLKSYTSDYFQTFPASVNTFPNPITFVANEDTLEAGYDFLVEPGSPSVKGSFETVYFSAEDLLSDSNLVEKLRMSSGKMIVIPPISESNYSKEQKTRMNQVIGFLKYQKDLPSAGTIALTNNKLTWSASSQLYSRPLVTVHADSISSQIDSVNFSIQNEFKPNYQTQNVAGYIEGKQADSLIVFIAHYDHLGMLGPEAIFTGANDNASGVAMLLSLARYYSENQPEYSTAFVAFGAEELGLLGSEYFTNHPLFDLTHIKFLINFDLAGTGNEGIQVVNGSVYPDKFEKLNQLNERLDLLPQVKIRGAACNSDHCLFDRIDIPNFYIYTLGGIPAYHDVYDRPETLPLTEFEDYFKLLTEFIDQL